MPDLTFVTLVESEADAAAARLLVRSLRAFGGRAGAGPVLVFHVGPAAGSPHALEAEGAEVAPLAVPASLRHVPFAALVAACAAAEERAATGPAVAGALVWADPRVLFCRPPDLLDLGGGADAALRPVHLANVGSPVGEALDGYWRRVYAAAGLDETALTVESFVDERRLRAYYNSHVQAVRPSLGLFRRRLDLVERLAADRAFTSGLSAAQQLFLFQAAFAALVARAVDGARIRLLPPAYGYPYNLHAQVPPHRQAAALDDLVCLAWEERSLRPERIRDVRVGERLRSWLAAEAPA